LSHPGLWHNRFFTAGLATLIALAVCGIARAENLLELGALDYTIMTPDGRLGLGHGRYTITHQPDSIVLHGESRYTTGEYDIEDDVLSPGLPGGLPTLEKFDHLFYSPTGALVRAAHADTSKSMGSCVDTIEHVEQAKSIGFPADTWAGASVLIPIQQFLEQGDGGTLNMHVFNCTSQPGVFAVSVSIAPRAAQLPLAASDVVQVNVKPHFGWYDLFLAPFVPKLNAWFDPRSGWAFEGVMIGRFYKGPQVLIVRSDELKNSAVVLPTASPSAGQSRP
jgi:hypothetical protein